MASWAKVSLVVLLAVQVYTCAALNIQEADWVSKHLKRPKGLGLHRSRHLGETTEKAVTENTVVKGWRANLIHPTYTQGPDKYTTLQKIQHDVEMSKERARFFSGRTRTAPYMHHGKGRKMLDFVADVSISPGSYSMEINIGTPPQRFTALADTGSNLVWLQCSTCDLCFDGVKFDPSVSSTYVLVGCPGCDILGSNQVACTPNCKFSYGYLDQSTLQGDFAVDTVSLNNTDGTTTQVPEFEFGCALRSNGTYTGIDGIVGLARGPISFSSQIAPFLNGSDKFSYCLLSRYDPESERSPLFFGEAAVPANLTVDYTPMLEPYNTSDVPYYFVSLLNITVGGTTLRIPESAFAIDETRRGTSGVVFDSGTTYTLLNTVAYQQVKAAFESVLDSSYPRVNLMAVTSLEVCYNVSAAQTLGIPSLTFNYDKADLDLEFENIVVLFSLQENSDTDLYMCLALLESPDINIFGNVQQQNLQVVYDEDNLRIGWVAMDCKSL